MNLIDAPLAARPGRFGRALLALAIVWAWIVIAVHSSTIRVAPVTPAQDAVVAGAEEPGRAP